MDERGGSTVSTSGGEKRDTDGGEGGKGEEEEEEGEEEEEWEEGRGVGW